MINKDNSSRNFLHFVLILATMLSEHPPPLFIRLLRKPKYSRKSVSLVFIAPAHLQNIKFTFCFNLPVIPLHLVGYMICDFYLLFSIYEQGHFPEVNRALSVLLLFKIRFKAFCYQGLFPHVEFLF